ncbi:hypothetical protein [Roseisolibacter sp. H3M3-2]|uniref:hypothetical protein n=1 Tax=Roseisolibacter sp. H3M3-2 TaxID=3031323 RepID=UPI0023DA3DD9|nr:hypothetical protein [Roseisolibacter sp. H3M3-2]MDF1504410.1 hypothetical protein [Roseisolibacter sp. H3M3-2]
MTERALDTDAAREFAFLEEGRTYTCRVEASRHDGGRDWWWVAVSNDPHGRHAPFRAVADESDADVRTRVLAFFAERQARRDAPWQAPWQRKRDAAAAPAAAPAAPAAH